MPLTDVKIRQAKATDKVLKLTDGNGLYLEVKPNGSKLWRYRYKIDGKENLYAVGEYPAVTLQDARKAREEARDLVKQGQHPSHVRKATTARQIGENVNTFKAVSEEWIAKKKSGWSAYYLKQVERGMEVDVYPFIGRRPLLSITANDILQVLNRVVNRGAETVAINIRQWCSSVCRYGVATLRADFDPVSSLRGAIIRPPVENAQAMSREQLKFFLPKLRDYGGLRTTLLAIRFMAYTFVRTVEMRRGAWIEVNFDEALWVIPGDKMKKKKAKAAYNHAAYLPARRDMMQVWADYIDAIEAEALHPHRPPARVIGLFRRDLVDRVHLLLVDDAAECGESRK